MGMLEDAATLLMAGRPAYGNPVRGPFPGVTASIQGGTMGDTPDIKIGLYDSTGFEPERAMGRIALDVRNLQVLVRHPDAVDGEALAILCFDILDQYVGTLNSTRYASILGRTMPFAIGPDENRRFRFSCNFKVNKDRP